MPYDCTAPSLTFGQLQSLIQLAIALNAAYFSFRVPNLPVYEIDPCKYADMQALINNDVIKSNQDLLDRFHAYFENYDDYVLRVDGRYKFMDKPLLYIAYSLCLIYIILLFVSSILYNAEIQDASAWLIFMVGYAPISISICIELDNRRRFNSLDKDGYLLIADAKLRIKNSIS